MLWLDARLSSCGIGKVVDETDMGYVCGCSHALWLRVFSVRMACSRKSNLACPDTIQPTGFERQKMALSLPTACSCWPCIAVSPVVYRCRIPDQSRLYGGMADFVHVRFRPVGSSASQETGILAGSVLAALHCCFDTPDSVLLVGASRGVWREV